MKDIAGKSLPPAMESRLLLDIPYESIKKHPERENLFPGVLIF